MTDDLYKQLMALVKHYGIQNVEEELGMVKSKLYPPLTEKEKEECRRAVWSTRGAQ